MRPAIQITKSLEYFLDQIRVIFQDSARNEFTYIEILNILDRRIWRKVELEWANLDIGQQFYLHGYIDHCFYIYEKTYCYECLSADFPDKGTQIYGKDYYTYLMDCNKPKYDSLKNIKYAGVFYKTNNPYKPVD